MDDVAITLRRYRSGDAPALQALDAVCFDARFQFTERAMRRFAEQPNAIAWLAESGGSSVGLAGFVIAHTGRGEAYLVTLDVAPERRRQGVAGQLVERIEQARSIDAVWLHVFVENQPAIRFYEHRGYARERLAKSFYGAGLDGWVYRRGRVR